MLLVPVKLKDGAERNGMGHLQSGCDAKSLKAWQGYLVRCLRRVPGGMDGLTWVGDHYRKEGTENK